jgi:hypothetical protein
MRKFRASLEPFWDLKIDKYVEYLMPVSSEYLISCELLSLTSTTGWTSRVFLAYVIPCAIYSTHSRMPRLTDLKFGSCTALLSSFLHRNRHVTIEVESVSDSIWLSRSLIEALACGTVYALYRWPFTTCTITTMQLLGTWPIVSFLVAIYFSETSIILTVRVSNRRIWHRRRWIWKMVL